MKTRLTILLLAVGLTGCSSLAGKYWVCEDVFCKNVRKAEARCGIKAVESALWATDYYIEACMRLEGYALKECAVKSADGKSCLRLKDDESEFAAELKKGLVKLPRNKMHLLQVSERKNCALWDSAPYKAVIVTWAGRCVDGWAEGKGEAVFVYPEKSEMGAAYNTGKYRKGRAYGRWSHRGMGCTSSGRMRDGKFAGRWKTKCEVGAQMSGIYKNNQPHGRWTATLPDGEKIHLHFIDGVLQQ